MKGGYVLNTEPKHLPYSEAVRKASGKKKIISTHLP